MSNPTPNNKWLTVQVEFVNRKEMGLSILYEIDGIEDLERREVVAVLLQQSVDGGETRVVYAVENPELGTIVPFDELDENLKFFTTKGTRPPSTELRPRHTPDRSRPRVTWV